MRDLTADVNELTLKDPMSGKDIVVYYRTPTAAEHKGYRSKAIQRKGKKIKVQTFEAQLKYGLKIILGFRTGDLGVDGKPISSKEGDDNYYPAWKTLMTEKAADIITALAQQIFEKSRLESEGDLIEFEDEGSDDENNSSEEKEEKEEKEDVGTVPLSGTSSEN